MKYEKNKFSSTLYYIYTINKDANYLDSYNNKPALIEINFETKIIRKTWFNDGVNHNVYGPAIITHKFNNKNVNSQSYFINGVLLSKEEWERHPEVIEHRIKELLNS